MLRVGLGRVTPVNARTGGPLGGGPAQFLLDFADLGAGVVSTVPSAGGVTATFTRATTAWTVLSDGTIGAVASGSPRSYYSPSGTYLGYLAEGARTNLCQRGEDFSAVWVAVGTPTLSAGTTTLGALSLSTVGDDSAAALEGYSQQITFAGDAVKAIAVYVKKGTSTSSQIKLLDNTAPANRLNAVITWSGTVPVVTMTTGTDLTGTPEQHGSSGVYRLLFATTSVTAANTNLLQIYPATDAASSVGGTGTIEIGGVQAEDATFPSSLIRTPASATVTRNADSLTYPVTGWFNAVTGSFFSQFAPNTVAATQVVWSMNDTTINEQMQVQVNTTPNSVFAVFDGGVQQAGIAAGTPAAGTLGKHSYAYAANDFAATFNGVAGTPDTSGTLPTVTRLEVSGVAGTTMYYGAVRRIAYFASRLSNAQLMQLTS